MSSPSASTSEHRVKSGETLSGIAQQHGITLKALRDANPDIVDPRLIKAGQKLIIPAPPVPEAQPPESDDSQPIAVAPSPARGDAAPASEADPNAILFEAESKGASDKTARQDKLPARGIHSVRASETMAETDRKRVMRHKEKFITAARQFKLPPALLAAIASRETRGGAVLDANGFGDGGNGFGLMQVDIGNPFPVIQQGGPFGQPHINQATEILNDKLTAVGRRFPTLSKVEQLQTAVSRYNGGKGLPAPDSDVNTTGDDYMNDVWARARFYARVEKWNTGNSSPA